MQIYICPQLFDAIIGMYEHMYTYVGICTDTNIFTFIYLNIYV